MRIKNLVREKIDNSSVNLTFDIVKNDGTLLLHVEQRNFTCSEDTQEAADAFLIQTLKNIRDVEVKKRKAKLADVVDSHLGQEIDIG